MKRSRAWTLALPFLAVAATIMVAEIYYRIRLGKPPDRVSWRDMNSTVEPSEREKIKEVPGARMRSTFSELKQVRTAPLKLSIPLPGDALANLPRIANGSYVGARMRPGKWQNVSRLTNGTTLFDVEFNVDKHGRRETLNPNPGKRKRYLLNFGCSFTFGDGMRDSETFSSRLAAALSEYQVYNYGIPGSGPHEAIASLEAMDRSNEIPEADGSAVYLFIHDHIRRATPSLSYFLERGRWRKPFYETDPAGNLRKINGYYSEHWLSGLLFSALSHSSILAYHFVDLPSTSGANEFRRVAHLLAGLARLYREKFGNDRFYVVIYPGAGGAEIGPFLGEVGVKYLDYGRNDLGLYTREVPLIHTMERHPTAEAYDFLARQVARDLFPPRAN